MVTRLLPKGLDPEGFAVGPFAVSLRPGPGKQDVVAYSSRVREGHHRVADVNAPGCRQMGVGYDVARADSPASFCCRVMSAATMPTTTLALGAESPSYLSMRASGPEPV